MHGPVYRLAIPYSQAKSGFFPTVLVRKVYFVVFESFSGYQSGFLPYDVNGFTPFEIKAAVFDRLVDCGPGDSQLLCGFVDGETLLRCFLGRHARWYHPSRVSFK